MSIDKAMLAKEMAAKYQEDELKWVLILKRLEKQGYGIYKLPNFGINEPFYDINQTSNKKVDVKYPNFIKSKINKVLLVPTNDKDICASCHEPIISNSEGLHIQYKGKDYCFQCALPQVVKWKEESDK